MSHTFRCHPVRPWSKSWALIALLVLWAAAQLSPSGIAAHSQTDDATPTPATGITTEVLGQGRPTDVSGTFLWLMRITFEPGAVAASHSHPGSTVFAIESGSITFSVEEGSVTVNRAGSFATPAAEDYSAGSQFTLNAGDTVFYESDAAFSEVNEGDAPVVILVANLRGVDEPARLPAATPAGLLIPLVHAAVPPGLRSGGELPVQHQGRNPCPRASHSVTHHELRQLESSRRYGGMSAEVQDIAAGYYDFIRAGDTPLVCFPRLHSPQHHNSVADLPSMLEIAPYTCEALRRRNTVSRS